MLWNFDIIENINIYILNHIKTALHCKINTIRNLQIKSKTPQSKYEIIQLVKHRYRNDSITWSHAHVPESGQPHKVIVVVGVTLLPCRFRGERKRGFFSVNDETKIKQDIFSRFLREVLGGVLWYLD